MHHLAQKLDETKVPPKVRANFREDRGIKFARDHSPRSARDGSKREEMMIVTDLAARGTSCCSSALMTRRRRFLNNPNKFVHSDALLLFLQLPSTYVNMSVFADNTV